VRSSEIATEDTQSTPTVLLIDDEPDLREVYALYLRQAYQVRTAATGNVSIETIRDEIDIVVTDRHMPDMTGDDLLRRLRDNGIRTPVIFLSAIDPANRPSASYQAYLTKPVDGRTLRQHVGEYT